MAACQQHDQTTLLDLAESWLVLQGQSGARVRPNTRASYRTGTRQLLAAFVEVTLLHPEHGAANAWIRSLEEAGLQPATVRARKAAASAFYKALRWAGATDADPFADVHVAADPVAPWDKRTPYEDADVNRLVAYARTHVEHRATGLVVLLGADAGLRASEMCALRWRDVNLRQNRLTVENGKGGKMRRVDISPRLAKYCAEYRARPPTPTTCCRTAPAPRPGSTWASSVTPPASSATLSTRCAIRPAPASWRVALAWRTRRNTWATRTLKPRGATPSGATRSEGDDRHLAVTPCRAAGTFRRSRRAGYWCPKRPVRNPTTACL